MIILLPDEREHFAAYLRQEAKSADELARQMAGMPGAIMEPVAKRCRAESMAFTIVAKILENTAQQVFDHVTAV